MKTSDFARTAVHEPRRGAAIVFSLIALLVASMLIAALIRMTGLAHRQMVNEELRAQANLIADSACDRGLASSSREADFRDETWHISAAQLRNGHEARVLIQVISDETDAEKKFLTVMVEYPLSHPNLVRVRRRVPLI